MGGILNRLLMFSKITTVALLLHSSEVTGFTLSSTINFPAYTNLGFSNAVDTALNIEEPRELIKSDAVVTGAGPAGLLTAIMLSKKFPNKKIHVFDRLPPPPLPTDEAVWSDVAKFYLIGLGARGQNALKKFGVWRDVEAVSSPAVGRKDWPPGAGIDEGVERLSTEKPVTTQVLPRDKLVGVLHQHVMEKCVGNIQLSYGYEVVPEDFATEDNTEVTLRINKCTAKAEGMEDIVCDSNEGYTMKTKLLIAADGTSRTVANAIENDDIEKRKSMNFFQTTLAGKPFRVRRYVDDNKRTYKTIPMKLPADWRPDLNYSARTKDGRVIYDALPADRNGNYCGALLLRADDEFSAPDCNPYRFRKLLNDTLPQFSALLDDETIATVAMKPPSYLPSFRYAGPRLHHGQQTLLLGDCAHTVKPYFGLGANSALEDVAILEEILDETSSIPEAVRLFSDRRADEAEVLVNLSRELDRPGVLGFLTFILPLILDSIFHGILPRLFAPNIITTLQQEGVTFRGVRRRKRMDRIGQFTLLATGLYGICYLIKASIQRLSKLTGKSSVTVMFGLSLTLILSGVLSKYLKLAPTSTVPKIKGKMTDKTSFLTSMGLQSNTDKVE